MNPELVELDDHCASAKFPWSIVDSSTPNAHLAAVLAGFMVTAIVFLLRREPSPRPHEPKPNLAEINDNAGDSDDEAESSSGVDLASAARIHTIAMFLSGVVVLGF